MSQSVSIECVVVHFDILPGIIGAPPREEYSARPVVVHQVMMNVQVLCIRSLLRRDRYSCFTSGDDVIVHLDVLRSEEHTSELQSRENLVCRLLLEKK